MKVPYKVLYFGVGTVLAGLSAKFPSLPLPPLDTVLQMFLALLGGHVATDITAILKTGTKLK